MISCAQLHKSYYAEQVGAKDEKIKSSNKATDTGLLISGEYDDKFSDVYFGLIHFVFENKTDRWITITDIQASFGEGIDKYANFISPKNQIHILKKSLSRVIQQYPERNLLKKRKNSYSSWPFCKPLASGQHKKS